MHLSFESAQTYGLRRIAPLAILQLVTTQRQTQFNGSGPIDFAFDSAFYQNADVICEHYTSLHATHSLRHTQTHTQTLRVNTP